MINTKEGKMMAIKAADSKKTKKVNFKQNGKAREGECNFVYAHHCIPMFVLWFIMIVYGVL